MKTVKFGTLNFQKVCGNCQYSDECNTKRLDEGCEQFRLETIDYLLAFGVKAETVKG